MNDTLFAVAFVVAVLLVFLVWRRRSDVRPAPPPQVSDLPPSVPNEPLPPPGDRSGDLTGYRHVRITHPLVEQAARRAAGKQTGRASMVSTDGRDMYFVLDAIVDDAERRDAHQLLTRFQAGEEADLMEVMALLRRLGGD